MVSSAITYAPSRKKRPSSSGRSPHAPLRGARPFANPRESRYPAPRRQEAGRDDMLWGIDPLRAADLLYALRRMGHGDEIVVVDANFPADSTAMSTAFGEPIPLAGVNAARAVEAIL